jgi:hypothetical protein
LYLCRIRIRIGKPWKLIWIRQNDADPTQSGSAFISPSRIRIGNTDPDPGALKLTKNDKITWFAAVQKGFCNFVGMSFDLDPDPH